MTPNDFARKVIHDYGVALDTEANGLVEELQAAALILAGMVIAITPETIIDVSGPTPAGAEPASRRGSDA